MLATMSTKQQILSLFSNYSWLSQDLSAEQTSIVQLWSTEHGNLFVTLGVYMIATVIFLFTVLLYLRTSFSCYAVNLLSEEIETRTFFWLLLVRKYPAFEQQLDAFIAY